MIMEYFEGQTLEDFIQKNGPLEINHAIEVFTQIAKSIEGLHELGIAHRDIKPENILINENMEVKLIDFNISKACPSHEPFNTEGLRRFRSVYHSQVSSPLYCAPELKSMSHYTESIDIWGLGVVLFTMLFGCMKTHSFSRLKTAEERSEAMIKMVTDKEGLSDECKTFIYSLLSKTPEDRSTAGECSQNEWVCI